MKTAEAPAPGDGTVPVNAEPSPIRDTYTTALASRTIEAASAKNSKKQANFLIVAFSPKNAPEESKFRAFLIVPVAAGRSMIVPPGKQFFAEIVRFLHQWPRYEAITIATLTLSRKWRPP